MNHLLIKVSALTLFLIAFLSCNNKESKDGIVKVSLKKFPEQETLTKKTSLNVEINTKMAFFTSLKDYVIVHDIYSSDEGIYILDRKSLGLITKTGRIGRGPGEIGRYGNIYPDEMNNSFYLADFGKNKIWFYQIDSLLSDSGYKPELVFNFSLVAGMWPLDFIVKENNLFFLTETEAFVAKVIKIDSVDFISKNKEKIVKKYDKGKPGEAFTTRSSFNAQQSKFAFAFRYADALTITDWEFNPLINIYGKGKATTGEKTFQDNVYYSHLKSDDKFLYAAYMNKPILREDKDYGDHRANFPQTIRVFNWEGKPVVELKFEDPFSDYFVDRQNNQILLYLTNKEVPLHVYQIGNNEIFN